MRKAKGGSDNGGGLFSMTFNEDAYKDFAEGQIYSLYIPFGEYKDGIFVKGSCEGYATLLVKIVPEYLTWQGYKTPARHGIMTLTGISLRKECI